jgi:hypothetical protein
MEPEVVVVKRERDANHFSLHFYQKEKARRKPLLIILEGS